MAIANTCEIVLLLCKGRYVQGVVTLGTLRGVVLASRIQKSGTGDNNFVKSGKWKGHFGPTDGNDQIGQSGPPSEWVPNIRVGLN